MWESWKEYLRNDSNSKKKWKIKCFALPGTNFPGRDHCFPGNQNSWDESLKYGVKDKNRGLIGKRKEILCD